MQGQMGRTGIEGESEVDHLSLPLQKSEHFGKFILSFGAA
jgi:hypothetical protein